MEVNVVCPVCGKEGKIEIEIFEGFNGFLDYDPPEKYARFHCNYCDTLVMSKWERNLDSPDLDLIKEVQEKLTISYPPDIIERVGKLCLLHLGPNLEWSEIIHRLKTL